MHCPYCDHSDTKVADKRDFGGLTRRRRECLKCKKRFNTLESLEQAHLRVKKKDGRIEDFNRDKLRRGILRACEKRPVESQQIDTMIANIEQELVKKGKEVSTYEIGDIVSKKLKKIDKIAYIRFSSVYREFTDISDFKNEIRGLVKG